MPGFPKSLAVAAGTAVFILLTLAVFNRLAKYQPQLSALLEG